MECPTDLSALTVPKLKEKCRELGIPVSGKKSDLIARIQSKTAPPPATGAAPLQSAAAAPSPPLPKVAAKRKPPVSELVAEKKKKKSSRAPEVTSLPPVFAVLSSSLLEPHSDIAAVGILKSQPQTPQPLQLGSVVFDAGSSGITSLSPRSRKRDEKQPKAGKDGARLLSLHTRSRVSLVTTFTATSSGTQSPSQSSLEPRDGHMGQSISNPNIAQPSPPQAQVKNGAPIRRFKGLKLDTKKAPALLENIKSTRNNSGPAAPPPPKVDTTSSSTQRCFPQPGTKDNGITASIIRNPPRYSHRRQIEKVAQVLALVAFHGFVSASLTAVPGDFLLRFSALSRNYRYASTLAFTHILRLEFPGKRTECWFKSKRVDETVADTRAWYWHRVRQRAGVIERVRTSWMERVWRFLVLGSSETANWAGPGRFGLWFSGVSKNLLADPDLEGQFETALRFWIRRFYVWVTKNGGGYPTLLQELREEVVQTIQAVDQKEVTPELWRVDTRCGGVHYIVGMTGEAVGWVEAVGSAGRGLEVVRLKRAKTRFGTMARMRTAARTAVPAFTAVGELKEQSNVNGATWGDLREDWREHASALVNSSETRTPPKRLLESVYRPSSKTVLHGIHESVKLPHHRVLAERWILAQVEPGGISGKPVLERGKQKVALDLQAKMTVEGVRCAGEKWVAGMKGTLAMGLGFVQTPGMGWFVLEETGQNIAQEEYGIQGLWATVLGVDEKGVLLSAQELEALAEMFVLKE